MKRFENGFIFFYKITFLLYYFGMYTYPPIFSCDNRGKYFSLEYNLIRYVYRYDDE